MNVGTLCTGTCLVSLNGNRLKASSIILAWQIELHGIAFLRNASGCSIGIYTVHVTRHLIFSKIAYGVT